MPLSAREARALHLQKRKHIKLPGRQYIADRLSAVGVGLFMAALAAWVVWGKA